jgi:heme-degrading monooxygenase HmoA
MLITVFRSRLKPGVRDEYATAVARMNELARTMRGYVSHKIYYAGDGERCTIVEFEHEEGLRAWRADPEHRAAQKMGAGKVLFGIPHSGLHARPRVEVRDDR